MHLRVAVETQQTQKVDLNWTCLFCSYGNGMVRLRTGPIFGSLFRTIRILNLFWTGSLGLFLYPCLNTISLLTAFWNGPERTSIKSHSWPCEGAYCIKFQSGQLNKHVSVRPQASKPWYPIVYETTNLTVLTSLTNDYKDLVGYKLKGFFSFQSSTFIL